MAGEVPTALWLMTGWKQGGPRRGPLDELIAGRYLDPMITCTGCDQPAVFADRSTDHKNVFASVEDGQLVFTVRGRDAVYRIFPVIPHTVRFESRVRHEPAEYGPGAITEGQTVFVNCRSSDASASSRRRCDVPSEAQGRHRQAQNTPRRIRVVAVSYDGAALMRNLDVRIRSEDLKKPIVVRSTGAGGAFVLFHPASDSVTLEALCRDKGKRQRTISGLLGLYVAPGADTTVQLLVYPDGCAR